MENASKKTKMEDKLEEKEYTETEGVILTRKRTTVERELAKHASRAHDFVEEIEKTARPPEVAPFIPMTLSGAIFCGHLVTDLDSIAGAIGAAELYGGIPSRASEVNSETAFALKHWGVPVPEPIEELLVAHPDRKVCLVDHQQTSQLNPAIDIERICGVIDHHALQNSTIVTDIPIYIDIRPWGSMSTIITHNFLTLKRLPQKETAGMLLCAILSDTLNLQGPTTTEYDRLMVAALTEIAEVEDLQLLASSQFKAKSSELAFLSPMQLLNGDQKVFTFKTAAFEGSVGFSVVETTDDAVILDKKDSLIAALLEDKVIKNHTVLFLAVVNIITLRSHLLVCGDAEFSLAEAAFPNAVVLPPADEFCSPDMMDLGNLVSRKKDFIPAVTKAIKNGWSTPSRGGIKRSNSDIFDNKKF